MQRTLLLAALAASAWAALLPAPAPARQQLKILPVRPCSTTAIVRTSGGQAIDLTGVWKAQLGTYFIRQVGSCVWWYGTSTPAGRFANVYAGAIQLNLSIVGTWADVPAGSNRNFGVLNLSIQPGAPLKIVRTKETGGFFDSAWTPTS